MKALVCTALREDFSGLELRDLPAPQPGPGEVLVQIEATSLNYPDLLLTQGKYQLKLTPPFTPGMDISGRIAGLGEDVTTWQVGEPVCGGVRFGGFADYVCIPAEALQAKPETMTHSEAAAYSAAYLTAYVALVRRARLQAGETLLVHGASGGVGMAAIDLGKQLGAQIIATGGSDDKLAKVKAYGADYVFNTRQGFREPVKELTGGRGADVIFDPVGGDVFDESVRCIAFDGRLLVIGFTSGRIATVPTNMPLIKGFSVVGVRAGEYGRQFPELGRENAEAIWSLARQGQTRPYIHDTIPKERGVEAFRSLYNREVVGKLILTP